MLRRITMMNMGPIRLLRTGYRFNSNVANSGTNSVTDHVNEPIRATISFDVVSFCKRLESAERELLEYHAKRAVLGLLMFIQMVLGLAAFSYIRRQIDILEDRIDSIHSRCIKMDKMDYPDLYAKVTKELADIKAERSRFRGGGQQ